ncbi:aminopeptidase P family protein [Marinococcus halophilus]|uniref:Peptidase M24 n=1 Tax=Marinococcus halophilus TaxID=1371 RepID=A0A510YAD4_MARHA|nr:aminopeptidase P family protein [Marinococcus halophilus]OZT80974.1 aminopeptidase P family protein [Marinococcus halophilus]GEK59357.1 peptidase M24 [Marinococcus halophilus]
MHEITARIREELEHKKLDALVIQSPYNRRYVSGFTGSAGTLIITKKSAHLITDFRYVEQANDEALDFDVIEQKGSAWDTVEEIAQSEDVSSVGFEKQHVTYAQFEDMREKLSGSLSPVSGIVEKQRAYKSKEEVEKLQTAVNIAEDAFEHIKSIIAPNMTELDVSNELEFYMRKNGAAGSSFDIIVASGWRGALPHGIASDKVIEDGELVTLDFGAYVDGYCSDITRTLAVGEPNDDMKKIYQTVYEAQMKAVEQVGPGMTGKEADAIARDHINKEGFGERFGHSLGHGLGMEVHEQPGVSPKSDVELEPGMVITIEPGIYVPELGGVRIEDDVLITETGSRKLSYSAKELTIVGN